MADDQPFPSRGAPVGVTPAPASTVADVGPAAPQAPSPAQAQPAPAQPAPAQQAAPQTAGPQTAPPTNAPARKKTSGRLFAILGGVVVLGAIAYGAYHVLVGSKSMATDDAYVGADVAQVTPQIAGTVTQVRVRDTQAVHTGDVLAVIDSADTRLAAAQAVANLTQAQRQVRQLLATNTSSGANVSSREAELARVRAQVGASQAEVERARVDLQRRQALSGSGAVSGEELTNARSALATAQSNLGAAQAAVRLGQANVEQARAQQSAQETLTAGSKDVETNPEVAAARAQLDTARLNMERTVLKAPLDGVIARRQVQVGQRVQVGQQLMTVVPLSDVYVDANFKEVQLRKIKVGQPVTLKADAYGSDVVFHGRVEGFSGGTGSAFAVIPAQNATGNWIKVVQRLPVRVRLDRDEVNRHPLRVGLSMHATVDISGAAPAPTGR